jgi:hypothetical protein
LNSGLKILAGHATAAIAGHQFDAHGNLALLAYALAFETTIDIDFCQVAGGSNSSQVNLDLQIRQIFMKPQCICRSLMGQILDRAAVRQLPLAFYLSGAANGAEDNLYHIRTADKLCGVQGALRAETFFCGLAAPGADGLHHIRTIWA